MTKNAYEIRLDVMAMAKEMLDKKYVADMNVWSTKLAIASDAVARSYDADNPTKATTLLDTIKPPVAPSVEEVIAKASALYSFVESDKR